MKSLAIALSVIMLLTVFSLGFSTLAQPSHIPHENPTTAYVPPDDPASLLRFYANLSNPIPTRPYHDAQHMLNADIPLTIPPALNHTLHHYHILPHQLATSHNNPHHRSTNPPKQTATAKTIARME